MSNLATFNAALASEKTKAMVKTALQERANDYFRSIAPLVANDTKLQTCDPVTIICGGLQAASLNLPLNKGLGFAWIIPYSNHGKMEAQFQLGAKGITQLAMRSGEIKKLNVTEIYEGEISNINRKTGEIELDGKKKSEKVVGYLAYFRLKNGAEQDLYMSVEDVKKHAKRFSKSFNSGPWQTDFDAMAKKTVLKKLLTSYAPMSVEMTTAVSADQAVIRENSVLDYVDSPASGVDEQEQPEEKANEAVDKVRAKADKVKAMARAAIQPNKDFDNEAPEAEVEDMPEGMFEAEEQ